MTILRIYICFILLFTVNLFCRANEVMKHLTNAHGLTNNSVNCIYEDTDNIVWIGTWDGLNAYNGREISTYRYYKNKNSISNNVVRQIIEQGENTLWISTDYGINKLNKASQQFTNYFPGSENNPPKQEKSFVIGKACDGRIICLVKDVGLFYYNEQEDAFVKIEKRQKLKVRDMVVDGDNLYVLESSSQLNSYKLVQSRDNTLVIGSSESVKIGNDIDRIFYSEGRILFQDGNSLGMLDVRNGVQNKKIGYITISQGNTITQTFSRNGILYASFLEGGGFTYNLTNNETVRPDLIPAGAPIFTMFLGSQDILWIGTDGQGVIIVHKATAPFYPITVDSPVRSFCELDSKRILVGTKGRGIKMFDKKERTLKSLFSTANGLISNSVYAMTKNKNQDIFIGTEGDGINILNTKSNQLETLAIPRGNPMPRAIYSLYFTHNDSVLWVGTSGNGLYRVQLGYVDQKYRIEYIKQFASSNVISPLNNDIIYTITRKEKSEELIFGTRGGGLIALNMKTNQIIKDAAISNDALLTNNDILCIQNTQSGLWVGTSYGLNNIFDNTGKYQANQFTEDNGLGNNTIHGILEDESKNIWLSTNRGISMIDIQNKQVEIYTTKDGLQSDEFSDGAYYKDPEGFLYFGGINGFNTFKKESIIKRSFTPTLKLSGLKIYNTNVNTGDFVKDGVLTLGYEERFFTLSFVTNDFIDNENCEYAYRLLDYSDQWIENGNNPNVVFSKLPPGTYQLEIRYTNGNKVWSDNVYTLKVNVAYPWWLSAPAIIVYAILFFLIVYAIQSVVKNRIRLNRQIMIEQIEKQHQQKEHESKLNFFTNVAHEFFTPLTLIYSPAEHLLENDKLDNYTKRYIQIIKNNAERMQKLISELMEFRKAKAGHASIYLEDIDISLLSDYVSDNYTEMAQVNGIDFSVEITSSFTICSDRDFLDKIFFNLFSNAFKYTPKDGYIHVNIWQDEDSRDLNLKIRNSGTGLTEKQMTEIFDKYKIFDTPRMQNTVSSGVGLNLTKSLVELLGGEITVSSQYGAYVEFALSVPSLKMSGDTNVIKELKKDTAVIPSKNIELNKRASLNILIVEDEKNIRELLKDILSPVYNILEASDGREALDIIDGNRPDIIISDVLMPNLDGIGLIKELRSNPKTMHIPVISISAKNAIEDQINAYEHGADLYITKPFHPRHILSTIENLINKHSILKEYFASSISSITVRDGMEIHKDDEKFILDIITFVQNNIEDESLNPNSIADFLGISKATLYRRLKETVDKTPSEFVRSIRLESASKLLVSSKLTVSEIMYKAGFSNKSYFYREFAKQYKASPKEYRDLNQPDN